MEDNPSKPISQHAKTPRVILFPLPFQGHMNPMMQLANILHTRGFKISILHHGYNSPDPSKYPDFLFHPIPGGVSEFQPDKDDPLRLIRLINHECIEPTRDFLGKLLSTHEDIACLVVDANLYSSQAAVEGLGIPRIVLRTSSVCSFFVFATLPVLHEKGFYSVDLDSRGEDPVLELSPLKVKDVRAIHVQSLDYTMKILRTIVEGAKTASGLIFNTFQDLEEPNLAEFNEHFRLPTFLVGPFHKFFSAASSSLLTEDRSSLSWLDTQKPNSVLYVSFGSAATTDEKNVREVAWGLANSQQPFLWVVRPGLVHSSEWLDWLPDELEDVISQRGYIVKWAPQQEVLSHPAIGGFWTHSGWNSILESVCEGVPMICSSFFGDQMVNSRYINDVWRLGIKLENGFDREEIESTIRKMMLGGEGREIRERALCLKEKVDVSLKTDRCSSQSLDALSDLITSFKSSGA